MPTRDIKTKLSITGESEYKSALSRINSELKNLQSALKLTASEFQTQANTVDALKAKQEALTALQEKQAQRVKVYADALGTANRDLQDHRDALQQASDAMDKAEQEWEEYGGAFMASKKAIEDHNAAMDRYKASYEEAQRKVDAAEQNVQKWETSLNKAKTELNDTGRELDETNGYLDEAQRAADGCATSIDQYGKKVKTAGEHADKAGTEIREVGEEAEKTGNKTKEAGDKSNAALDALAANIAFEKINTAYRNIRQAITECIDASVAFESAMAGVAKTTDLTDDELAEMGDALQEMSTRIPTAASDLASITEAAGQLGIKKENLLAFTEVMANLGVATNLSAEEAASALAKFANVVKMDADNYGRLGSVIVALGNNFATTESDIVSMATRIASTGAIIDLTEPQIMAIATALSSVGIEAEAGGSAISKLLKNMEVSAKSYETANTYIEQTGKSLRELELLADQDSKGFKAVAESLGLTSGELKAFMEHKKTLEQFADVAGTTADEFINRWGEDAVQALDAFIVGLNDTDRTGKSAVETLNDMGLTEIRLSNAVLSLASNGHILTDSVNLANDAWRENTALTKEAETRYNTTESKLQLLDNSVQALKASVGDQLTPALRNLADTGIDATKWAEDMIEQHPWIVQALGAVTGALGGVTGAVMGAKVIQSVLIPLFTGMTNPAGLAVIAIAGITGALIALNTLAGEKTPSALQVFENKTKELTSAAGDAAEAFQTSRDAYQESLDAMQAQNDEIDRMVERVEKLAAKENLTAGEKATMLDLIKRLNAVYPELNLQYEEETKQLNLSAEAIRKKIEARRNEEKLTSLVERQIELEGQLADAQKIQDDLIAQKADALRGIQAAQDRYNAAEEKTANLAYECSYAIDSYNASIEELDGAIESNYGQMQNLRDEYAQTETAVEELSAADQDLAEAETDAAEAAEESAMRQQEAAETEVSIWKSKQEHIDDLKESLERLQKAYSDVYEASYNSLMGQMDMWGQAEDKSKVTLEQMTKNVDEYVEVLKNRTENMQVIMDAYYSGQIELSDTYIQKLTDNSEESNYLAQQTADAVRDGETQKIEAYNDTLRELEHYVSVNSGQNAQLRTDYAETSAYILEQMDMLENGLQGMAARLHDAGYQSGSNFAAGFTKGINDGKVPVANAAEEMTSLAIRQVRRTQMEQSPAKVPRQSGAYFAEGYALGIGDKTPEAVKAAEAMAKAVQTPIERLRDRLQGIQSEIAAIVSEAAAQAQQQAASITSSVFQMQSALGGTSGGFSINYDNDTAPSWLGSGAYEPSAERIAALGWRLPDLTPQPLASGGGNSTQQNVSLSVEVREMSVREESDIQRIGEVLYQQVRQQARSAGVIL